MTPETTYTDPTTSVRSLPCETVNWSRRNWAMRQLLESKPEPWWKAILRLVGVGE